MLTNETLDKAISLLEEGCTYLSITHETSITREEAEAVALAYDAGKVEQLYREIALAGILDLAAAKLRSGEGLEEGTVNDVLLEINHVYPEHAKAALASVSGENPTEGARPAAFDDDLAARGAGGMTAIGCGSGEDGRLVIVRRHPDRKIAQTDASFLNED
jgi:ABC-type glutathione transport system ATPase component